MRTQFTRRFMRRSVSCKKAVRYSLSSPPILWHSYQFSALIGGGGAPEIHVSRLLSQYSQSLKGMEAYCFQAYADALEVIPTTLAENAGLNPIAIVTELRNRHALGERSAGINVRKVCTAAKIDNSSF
jgi:chaperonin GroEL (HSP60 family)